MGEWFARFFQSEGYIVHVSGTNKGPSKEEMAKLCRVVIVSVPISVTDAVIREIGPHMRKDDLLMDLTSVKRQPVNTMIKCSNSEVIGCHPLFGPQVPSIEGQNVVICTARGEKWVVWIKDVFNKRGANLVEITPEMHDQMMAIVQGLNHLNSVTFGVALSKLGLSASDLKPFFTPAFEAKFNLAKRVFHNNPELYAEILTMNPDTRPIAELYVETASKVRDVINKGDMGVMTALIKQHAPFFKTEV